MMLRTSAGSRKRTSAFAGCTFTSISRGSTRDEQRHDRIAVAWKIIRIGRPHDAEQELVAHRPLVDEQILAERIARGYRSAGLRSRRCVMPLPAPRDLDGVCAKLATQDIGKPRQSSRAAPQVGPPAHRCALLARKRERQIRPAHCESANHFPDRLRLAAFALQKFQPRRSGVEKIMHLDARTDVERGGFQLLLPAGIDGDAPGMLLARMSGFDGELRHGAN